MVCGSTEDGAADITGVTFAGQSLPQASKQITGSGTKNAAALFYLLDAGIGAGAQTGDIVVSFNNTGANRHIVAVYLTNAEQAAPDATAMASNPANGQTSLSGNITTTADDAITTSCFSIGDAQTWSPDPGQTSAGYETSGSAAGGASYEIHATAGLKTMGWSGASARRPTLAMAAFAQAARSGTGVAGEVLERHGYGPYGELTSLTGIPFRYTGHRLDPETGLYYMRARYYSAGIGRFLSPDPIGFADGPNLYVYVNNDPLNAIDPLGLDTYFLQFGATIVSVMGGVLNGGVFVTDDNIYGLPDIGVFTMGGVAAGANVGVSVTGGVQFGPVESFASRGVNLDLTAFGGAVSFAFNPQGKTTFDELAGVSAGVSFGSPIGANVSFTKTKATGFVADKVVPALNRLRRAVGLKPIRPREASPPNDAAPAAVERKIPKPSRTSERSSPK